MKIVIDARPVVDPAKGGVSRVALQLIERTAKEHPSDTIECVTTGWKKPTLPDEVRTIPNIEHRHLTIPNKLWSALSWLGLVSFDADIYPNIGFIGRQRKPYMLLLHDLSFLIEPRWFNWKQRLWHRAVRASDLIRRANRLLVVSETTKNDAARLLDIPPDRMTVIPIGPTLDQQEIASSQTPRNDKRRYVLALGWNDPRKNTQTAIEAVRIVQKDFPDLKIVIPTNAEGSSNWKISRQARNDNSFIQFVAKPTDDELASLYANASAFLYPSWYEGYGLPLHEAARFGTPRIASTTGALPETAPPGTLFANPAKPHHWAEALREILTRAD